MVQELLNAFLPYVYTAGQYAAEVQNRVGKRAGKSAANAFQAALTNADLSIQNFLEVAALAIDPSLRVMGEEYRDSLNSVYFPEKAELSILIDPIDGTRVYQDGGTSYSVILSILRAGEFQGAVSYHPKLDTGYYATREGGSVVFKGDPGRAENHTQLLLPSPTRRLVVYMDDEARDLLSDYFEVFDPMRDYDPKNPYGGLSALYTGQLAGFISGAPQLIDWGAFSFIAERAGAVASQRTGAPLPPYAEHPEAKAPSLVVGASPELHQELLSVINVTVR